MIQCNFRHSHKQALWGIAFALAGLIVLAACGGGGGGSSAPTTSQEVRALALPDRIQLTNVQDQNGAARAAAFKSLGLGSAAYDDAGTDYANEAKRSWVDDTDALEMINTILGVLKETAYENFVNLDPYKALVRDDDESSPSQSGASTTSTATEALMEIIVEVDRESNDDPMMIKIWLYVNGPDDGPMLVRGHFTVSQGVSAEYPYGVMEAHFKGNSVDGEGAIGIEVMQMSLSVTAEGGQVIIENIDDEGIAGGWESHRKVRVVANADVTQGNAYVSVRETGWVEGEGSVLPDVPTITQIAFNETYFKETPSGEAPVIYAKDDLKKRIFRYKLFDAATGAAVTRSSGFPIEFDTDSGTKNGYVGYYGLWTNNNLTLANGAAVRDMEGNGYTVFRAAGKLTKHTRNSTTLSELTGVEMTKYVCSGMECQDTVVTWNGTNFVSIGYRDQTNGQIIYASGPVVTFLEWEGAWCESLKAYLRLGNLFYDDDSDRNTPPVLRPGASTVSYHAEHTLTPSEALSLQNVPLYTWSYTLAMPITQTVVDTADQNSYWGSPEEKTFYFDPQDMLLKDGDGNSAVLTGLTIPAGSNLQWGYHVGPLTTSHFSAETSWQANDAEEYYSWNTGADQWNQYVTVRDESGNFASFDPPLSFTYTHLGENDANDDDTNDGKIFRLEYDGFSLNMPWAYDPDSGEWVPLINLADGVQLTSGGAAYVVKGVEQAYIMTPVPDPAGITFANEEEVGAPELVYDATKTDLVGAVPTGVTLKVIKGIVLE
ncbi:MAG: hypothetical protein C4519_02360 [Desulfobacteraceae bacterium]|nr:MAG: hypothetical protein C4519_02360 [Desulfobacteraceae bacterium]